MGSIEFLRHGVNVRSCRGKSNGFCGSTRYKKSPHRCELFLFFLVAPLWVEHSTNGFWFVWLSPLPGLCLHHGRSFRWVPSSLYTFLIFLLGFARHCLVHFCRQVSPNLTPSHIPFPKIWHNFLWVRCSNQAWAKGPKTLLCFYSFYISTSTKL